MAAFVQPPPGHPSARLRRSWLLPKEPSHGLSGQTYEAARPRWQPPRGQKSYSFQPDFLPQRQPVTQQSNDVAQLAYGIEDTLDQKCQYFQPDIVAQRQPVTQLSRGEPNAEDVERQASEACAAIRELCLVEVGAFQEVLHQAKVEVVTRRPRWSLVTPEDEDEAVGDANAESFQSLVKGFFEAFSGPVAEGAEVAGVAPSASSSDLEESSGRAATAPTSSAEETAVGGDSSDLEESAERLELEHAQGGLERRVADLEERISVAEAENVQLNEYRRLYKQAECDDWMVSNLEQQLYAVQSLKEMLHAENDSLRGKLRRAAQRQDSPSSVCVICMEGLATVVCLPCRHMATCVPCGAQHAVSACPICRAAIEANMEIYLP